MDQICGLEGRQMVFYICNKPFLDCVWANFGFRCTLVIVFIRWGAIVVRWLASALMSINMFTSGFTQSVTTHSCIGLQAEATIEIHDNSHGTSNSMPMVSHNAATTIMPSNSTTSVGGLQTEVSSANTISHSSLLLSQPSSTSFNTPLPFGSSRTLLVNSTSTNKCMTTGICQTATAKPSQLGSNTSGPHSSIVAGSGVRHGSVWSHVFLWAALAEMLYFLNWGLKWRLS